MKRWTIRISICLLLGAILNVAVAFAAAMIARLFMVDRLLEVTWVERLPRWKCKREYGRYPEEFASIAEFKRACWKHARRSALLIGIMVAIGLVVIAILGIALA